MTRVEMIAAYLEFSNNRPSPDEYVEFFDRFIDGDLGGELGLLFEREYNSSLVGLRQAMLVGDREEVRAAYRRLWTILQLEGPERFEVTEKGAALTLTEEEKEYLGIAQNAELVL